jgi:hypothetical protein
MAAANLGPIGEIVLRETLVGSQAAEVGSQGKPVGVARRSLGPLCAVSD